MEGKVRQVAVFTCSQACARGDSGEQGVSLLEAGCWEPLCATGLGLRRDPRFREYGVGQHGPSQGNEDQVTRAEVSWWEVLEMREEARAKEPCRASRGGMGRRGLLPSWLRPD